MSKNKYIFLFVIDNIYTLRYSDFIGWYQYIVCKTKGHLNYIFKKGVEHEEQNYIYFHDDCAFNNM